MTRPKFVCENKNMKVGCEEATPTGREEGCLEELCDVKLRPHLITLEANGNESFCLTERRSRQRVAGQNQNQGWSRTSGLIHGL